MSETTTTTAEPAEEKKPDHRNDPVRVEPLADPLQFVRDACYGYLPSKIEHRWCRHLGLRFTPPGMARACQVFGWLAGLGMTPDEKYRDFAARAARDFCDQLDRLACYGGAWVDKAVGPNGNEYEVSTPRYVVELSDDGTFGGFTVLWFPAIYPDNQKHVADDAWQKQYDDVCRYHAGPKYRFSGARGTGFMNGGLLYHGPGSDETFAVQLGSGSLWSIHT